MILCWQKIVVSQHEIVTLRLMENVQFLILFWPQQSHDSCGVFSRKKVSGKKDVTWQSGCCILHRIIYANVAWHTRIYSYAPWIKPCVLPTLIFFLFVPFPLRLESRGYFILCQRSCKISKYCISPSVGLTSYVGLEKKNSYQWKNVCCSPNCGGCHGLLHVCPSLIPWADILESLMWNRLITTKCPLGFTWQYLLRCSERCFPNQPRFRLLPILVWLSYWPLSSTCSCSLFASLLLQPLDVCVCSLHLSQLDHPPSPTPDCTPTSAGIFQGYMAVICLFVNIPGSWCRSCCWCLFVYLPATWSSLAMSLPPENHSQRHITHTHTHTYIPALWFCFLKHITTMTR